jgi:hypothetical protein
MQRSGFYMLCIHYQTHTISDMTADQYLQTILAREQVDVGPFSAVRGVQTTLLPIIRQWAGGCLVNLHPSGSFAKGTANRSGTDIDLFISLHQNTPHTLSEIYSNLQRYLEQYGYTPRRQNVSLNIRVNGYSVDLVPAKHQDLLGADHSLYRRRADTWTKTNVVKHVSHILNCRRTSEIRVLKLWRDQQKIDFPSFYLELTVIQALAGAGPFPSLSINVWTVFQYLRDRFPNARVLDPANSNNVISTELSDSGKMSVKAAAERALRATNWNEIVV